MVTKHAFVSLQPPHAKIAKESKDTIQECVSEFISFITSEGLARVLCIASLKGDQVVCAASDKCRAERRKTINGDDLLWAMTTLGFDDYIEPLKIYLARYRDVRRPCCGQFP
jgi:nuclear transcription Y subunit beta